MSGTSVGGKRAAAANISKYGDDFYKRIGQMGGAKKVPKGFASDNRTRWQKLRGVPKRASLAGRRGGSTPRRTRVLADLGYEDLRVPVIDLDPPKPWWKLW